MPPADQLTEGEQVIDEEVGASPAELEFDCRLHEVRPLHGDGPHNAVHALTDHAPACGIGVLANTLELLSSKWVKRVDDPYKMSASDRKGRTLK